MKLFKTRNLANFITALLCSVFFFSIGSGQDQKAMAEFKQFDEFYEASLKQYGIFGSSFAFVHDNKIVDEKFYGMAHVADNRKIDKDTIYHWASITKTFTGIAVMQLRDRGKLKLEDPLTKYVPEVRLIHNPFGSMDEITISQLLSHTAGFRAGTFPFGGDKNWHPPEPTKWEQLVAMMPYTEVLFKPGSKYGYSNPGIVYLGQVIERVSGEDYEVYMDKNVLKPLAMYNSFFDTTPHHLLKNRSHSYRISQDGKLIEGRFDMDTGITVSNGGLNSTFPDMLKYLDFLIGNPKKQAEYDVILKRSSLEEMFQPVAEVLDEPVKAGNKIYIGKTFFVQDYGGQRFIGHSGYQNGFRTQLFYQPATRSAYIVAFNTYANSVNGDKTMTTDRLNMEIKEYMFEKIFPLLKK